MRITFKQILLLNEVAFINLFNRNKIVLQPTSKIWFTSYIRGQLFVKSSNLHLMNCDDGTIDRYGVNLNFKFLQFFIWFFCKSQFSF